MPGILPSSRRDRVPLRRVPSQRPDARATFIHEYIHYLQNVSLLAGASSFLLWQIVLSAFSHTLSAVDGTSRGSGVLDPKLAQGTKQWLEFAAFLDGDCELIVDGEDFNGDAFALEGVTTATENFQLPDGTVERRRVTLQCSVATDTGPALANFHFGMIALEEGIAYELDRMVASDGGDGSDNAPPFPYLVLRELGLREGPERFHRIVLVFAAVLALQTTDPPRTLLSELADLKALAAGAPLDATPEDIKTAIEHLVERTRAEREGATKELLRNLMTVLASHQGRGVAEDGARALVSLMTELLERRLKDPFWELRPFAKNVVDSSELLALLGRVLPCDVIQERDGPRNRPERDVLLRFGLASEAFERAADGMRVLQCQLDMVHAHLNDTDDFVSNPKPSPCPFYTSCDLEERRRHASICEKSPWKIVHRGNSGTCWYGAAVGALRGGSVEVAAKPAGT